MRVKVNKVRVKGRVNMRVRVQALGLGLGLVGLGLGLVYISGVPIHKNEWSYARINAFIKLFSTFWIALLSR